MCICMLFDIPCVQQSYKFPFYFSPHVRYVTWTYACCCCCWLTIHAVQIYCLLIIILHVRNYYYHLSNLGAHSGHGYTNVRSRIYLHVFSSGKNVKLAVVSMYYVRTKV